jgi:hypothetical protein
MPEIMRTLICGVQVAGQRHDFTKLPKPEKLNPAYLQKLAQKKYWEIFFEKILGNFFMIRQQAKVYQDVVDQMREFKKAMLEKYPTACGVGWDVWDEIIGALANLDPWEQVIPKPSNDEIDRLGEEHGLLNTHLDNDGTVWIRKFREG